LSMVPGALADLAQALRGARRIAVLGVGSDLRSDDAVGLVVAAEVEKQLGGLEPVKVFLGHTAPENFSGAIKAFAPTHLVAIDAGALGREAGEVAVLREPRAGSTSFCTHALPLEVMFTYLQGELPGLEVAVIAIEPESMVFGEGVSPRVSQAASAVSRSLAESIRAALAAS